MDKKSSFSSFNLFSLLTTIKGGNKTIMALMIKAPKIKKQNFNLGEAQKTLRAIKKNYS